MRYGTKTRDDELRLEQDLLELLKLPSDTIDAHIQKFDDLLSALHAQQLATEHWDTHKVNRYFLRSLERASIPNEDWKAFSTYLGRTWHDMTLETLYSEARTYYNAYMAPLKASAVQQERILAISASQASSNSPPPSSQAGRGRGNNQQGRGGGRGRGRGGNSGNPTPRNLPRDPNAYCTECGIQGHSLNYCYKRYRASNSSSTFEQWCKQQSMDPVPAATPPPYTAPPVASSQQRHAGPHTEGPRNLTIRVCKCTSSNDPNTWLYDSCCTQHMTDKPLFFTTYDAFEALVEVYGINGTLYAYGKGTVTLADANGNTHDIHDVWYVPNLGDSIIAKSRTNADGLRTSLDDHENVILYSRSNSFRICSSEISNMTLFKDLKVIEYISPTRTATAQAPTTSQVLVTATDNSKGQLWHERLAHVSAQRLRLMGIRYKPGNCHFCVLGKQTRKPFPAQDSTVEYKLERVYSDLCPISPESFGHGKYIITFVDQITRYAWIYIIPNKSSSTVLQILKSWLALVQNQSGRTLINFRTDEGTEYTGETLRTVTTFLSDHGITHETTSAASSSSNGVAERMNRTLMDMVRPMLLQSGVPSAFWGEAVHTAAKIRNRLPTSSLKGNISPHEAWFGKPPKISHFRRFGCAAYARITHPVTKVIARSNHCCLLGYEGTTQYRLFDPKTNKVLSKVRNVTFFENEFLDPSEFVNAPYADRPLMVPEPRNYSEEDEELDPDDLPELTPIPVMPEYHPAPRPATVPPPLPPIQPQWPIPAPPQPSGTDSDTESTLSTDL